MKLALVSLFSKTNFKGKIIDSHVHTGYFLGKTYGADSLDVFVRNPLNVNIQGAPQQDTVEKMFVSNLSAMIGKEGLDETDGNLEMLQICSDNKKLIPLAVCEPEKTRGDAETIEKLTENNDFYGLKFHPESSELRANHSYYDAYLDLAERKGFPCVFHTQVNIDWKPDDYGVWHPSMSDDKDSWNDADPAFVYELAKRHPKVPVIMAHLGSGGEMAHQKAIDILVESLDKNDANLYCDISWVDFQDGLPDENCASIVQLISKLKEKDALDRILFGTDAPLGCYGEAPRGIEPKAAYEKTVSAFKTAIKNNFKEDGDSIIQKIFYDNAKKLFFGKREND